MSRSLPESRSAPRLAAVALAGLVALLLAAPSARSVSSAVHHPRTITLTNAKVARWAVVLKHAAVHSAPTVTAPLVTRLSTYTSDGTQNIVLVLEGRHVGGLTWYRVRLPILPNNSTGWVVRGNVGRLYVVHTHLYVDSKTLTATLVRNGVAIFRTRVGIGAPHSPTPRGQFYIRDKLTGFGDPYYGPVAFGTNGRSAVLTDWPGGGFIGVHGTNEPQVLPGRVSHGCIRLRNASIVRLAKLMPVGTPLTVR